MSGQPGSGPVCRRPRLLYLPTPAGPPSEAIKVTEHLQLHPSDRKTEVIFNPNTAASKFDNEGQKVFHVTMETDELVNCGLMFHKRATFG